jgi:hypothetical protein
VGKDIPVHAKEQYGPMYMQLQSFLTSALHAGDLLALRCENINCGKKAQCIHSTRDCVMLQSRFGLFAGYQISFAPAGN